jgi:hypothetical protein
MAVTRDRVTPRVDQSGNEPGKPLGRRQRVRVDECHDLIAGLYCVEGGEQIPDLLTGPSGLAGDNRAKWGSRPFRFLRYHGEGGIVLGLDRRDNPIIRIGLMA